MSARRGAALHGATLLLSSLLGVSVLGCAPAADSVRLGVATAVMDHGGVAKLVHTVAEQGLARVDLLPLQPAQALALLGAGDVDAAIVESRPDAEAYVARHPQSRLFPLWRLSLVLVGPAQDPAAVKGQSLKEAFRRIAETDSPFVSMADRSGVHRREQELWVDLGAPRRGAWYQEAGYGHDQALLLAKQRLAYWLTDAATAAVAGADLGALTVLVDGGETEALPVDLVVGDQRQKPYVWRMLADALPAGVAALPKGYGPLSPAPVSRPSVPVTSKRSR